MFSVDVFAVMLISLICVADLCVCSVICVFGVLVCWILFTWCCGLIGARLIVLFTMVFCVFVIVVALLILYSVSCGGCCGFWVLYWFGGCVCCLVWLFTVMLRCGWLC